jgi:ANTAR domain-containing protein/GAF domain-containing protein
VIPGADLASITVRSPDGRFHTPVHTDEAAAELDQVQYELAEGPCLTAADQNGPALAFSGDLRADTQWPRFAPVAVDRGWSAVCSTALLPAARLPRLSGALNLYSRKAGGLTEQDYALALLLATHASLALAYSTAVEAAELQAHQLHRAIDSRDVIGQAKGILMARRGYSPSEAFDFLRTTSQDLNVKLIEVAENLATRHQELDRQPGEAN